MSSGKILTQAPPALTTANACIVAFRLAILSALRHARSNVQVHTTLDDDLNLLHLLHDPSRRQRLQLSLDVHRADSICDVETITIDHFHLKPAAGVVFNSLQTTLKSRGERRGLQVSDVSKSENWKVYAQMSPKV